MLKRYCDICKVELDKEKLKYDNDLRIYTLRNTFDFQKEVLQEILEEGRNT